MTGSSFRWNITDVPASEVTERRKRAFKKAHESAPDAMLFFTSTSIFYMLGAWISATERPVCLIIKNDNTAYMLVPKLEEEHCASIGKCLTGIGEEYYDRHPHEFSGGQRQRISIARAIALRPKLVLCDEPVSALDVSIQSQILNLLKDLQKQFGLTYIFISHALNVVKHVSDRVAVMYLGRIVEIASVYEIYEHPRHPYTQALLSSIPVISDRGKTGRERIVLEGDLPNPKNPPTGCRFHTRCRYATPICAREEPELRTCENGTQVACHSPIKI